MLPLPFDAAVIAQAHSGLTGLLAGFAFAALFLLVERLSETKQEGARARYRKTMLLLFVASVTGTVASFLFAMVTGDPPRRALAAFLMPSAVFALSAMVLLLGINLIFNTFNTHQLSRLARHISYVTVLFVLAAVWDTGTAVVRYFEPVATTIWLLTLLAVMPPATVLLLVVLGQTGTRRWFEGNTFVSYCYAVIGSTIVFGGVQLSQSKVADEAARLSLWVAIVVMALTATLGAWTMLLFPKEAGD